MKLDNLIVELEVISGYCQGPGLLLGDIEPKDERPKGAFYIHERNPEGDMISDFASVSLEAGSLQYVRAFRFLRNEDSILGAVAKCLHLLRPGGYLIIADNIKPDEGSKHYFNFPEMEGLLNLFEDVCFIQTKGTSGSVYYYIAKKKKNPVDDPEDDTIDEIQSGQSVLQGEPQGAGGV